VEQVPGSGERKLVTVLFADLVGSTASASDEDPERVRARLDRFYDAMTAEIESAGGTVEKFAGDAVMAAFGAPAALEDHAERALHVALAMQRRVRELDGGRLQLRIGVNTGEVVVGHPREGSSFVTGDPVNVAARLEQAAEAGEILAGERTVATVRGAFEFGEPTTIEAKGKQEGVPCRRLVRALSLMRPRGVGGLRKAFVGRERELAALEAAYRSAVELRRPQLVTIVGEAGVGKTRLVRELWQWLAEQEPQPLQRTGRCLSYGQVTYWAMGEVLREQLGLLDSDPAEAALERLGDREILGLTLGLDVAGDLHPLVARDRFQDAWVELLGELAAERPTALLVEDLHWAEEPLLDLLEHLLAAVEAPLLVLVTARPELLETRPGWGSRAEGATVRLEPLDAASADLLLAALLGSDPPSPLKAVVARAEGNPFFVEEIIGALVDQGLLERRNGGWELGELPAGFAVPDTVQAVVAARVDLLESAEKTALQAASVIGRVFWSGPIYELLEGLEPDLRVLEERDFIRLRLGSSIEGEREYAIKHAVTREVAYSSIPKAKRARLHAAFADWVERFGGGRDEHAPLLAHHYAEAVRPEDVDLAWPDDEARLESLRVNAVRWLRRAAELAVGGYEIDEALAYMHRALELERDESERSAIWREIGRANALKFDGPAFWEAMLESLRTCYDKATCGETYSLLAFHTVTRSGMWKQRPDRELVDGWIEQALELSEPGSEAYVRGLIARAYWHPDFDQHSAVEASALAEELGDPELRSYAMMARSSGALEHGRLDEAFEWAERRFDLMSEISDPDHVVEILETAIPVTAALGRFQETRRHAWEHVERSQRLTPHHRMHGIAVVVETEELAGHWEAIRNLTARVEQAVEENEATPCVRNARSLYVTAAAHLIGGDAETASRLERAADALETHPWSLLAPQVRLALVREDLGRTRALLDEWQRRIASPWSLVYRATLLDALAALRDCEAVEEEASALIQPRSYLEPFALRALGIVREDEALIEQAQGRFAALELDWHAAQTDFLVRVGRSL
jgi:class 3 adenylate cyclase